MKSVIRTYSTSDIDSLDDLALFTCELRPHGNDCEECRNSGNCPAQKSSELGHACLSTQSSEYASLATTCSQSDIT